ncbi:MAG: PEP/pyruvate-binding domain-containing protein, partial [Veillonella parvula]
MNRETAYVLWFDELQREDVNLVGGKSSSLGELTSSTNVPVPYGFATTAHGYREFMKATGLEDKIRAELDALDDVENSALLREVCAKIRRMICQEKMPKELADAIRHAYEELGKKVNEENPFVAVRSSATAEDLPDASFAGQQDTYLNVRGADVIIEKVKECYASTFTDRATYYRVKQGFDHMTVALSAAVQMMVFSKAAGVMFTVDLVTGNDNNILIEGSWGLGEYVVQGTVTPDNFRVDKEKMEITDRMINDKQVRLVRKADGDCVEEVVPADEAKQQVITDAQVLELAEYAKAIEKHYGCYMDMEWGVDERNDKIWILQARPETVWSRKEKSETSEKASTLDAGNRDIIVKGLPASPGNAAGKAHVIINPEDIDEFKEGEILVTAMTAPDWVPAMKKA